MLLLVGLFGGLAAAPASASTISISFSADPTQEKPFTITVRGSSDGARRVHVFVTTDGCAASVSEQSGTRVLSVSGEAVDGGGFAKNYSFTGDQRTYRVCAFLVNATGGAVDVRAEATVTPRGGRANAAVVFSADPTQDKPVTASVSGSSELARRLHVFVTTGGCSTSSSVQSGTRLTPFGGAEISGAFSRDYVFTPDEQRTYRVCVFVERWDGVGAIQADATVTPRGGRADAAVVFSADPTQDKPVTASVSGSSELARRLHVFVTTGGCSTSSSVQSGTRLTPGEGADIGGAFSYDYVFTPDEQRTYWVCVFVERWNGEADATNGAAVTPRGGIATVAISIGAPALSGQPVPLVVSGSSELARRLHLFATTGECATSLSGQSGTRLTPNDGAEVNGVYTQNYVFTPEREGAHAICAFVARGPDGSLDATGKARTTVGVPRREDGGRGGSGSPADRDEDPPWLAAPANLLTPANGAVGLLLSPTFTWTSADVEHDILVLAYRKGKSFHPYMAVSRYGATWVSAKNLKSQRKLFDALEDPYARAEGWASLSAARAENTATVRFGKVIEPGRYRWTVYTGSESRARTLVPSEQREFTVHGPALRSLQVRARSRPGRTAKSPGETDLRISVTRYASVRVELRRDGRLSVQNYSAADGSKFTASVDWSCKKPGGRYRYRVIARDSHGKQMTRSGTFRPVSAARCRTMRKQEQRAKAARKRNADRRVAERRRAEAAAQQARIDRFKSNCRKLGGTPELIHSSDSSYWVCVSPWGGTWNVPY